jgi:hypothetical protein
VNGTAGPQASGVASDLIWGWDAQTAVRDSLRVAAGSTAVIGSMRDMDPSSASRWDGADIVDLRDEVTNLGVVVVSAEAGRNTVYGSGGMDHIYGSAGAGQYNQVWGGAGSDTYFVGASDNGCLPGSALGFRCH